MLKKISELDVQMCDKIVDYIDTICGAVRVRDESDDTYVLPVSIHNNVVEADVKSGGGFLDMFNAFANAFYDGDVTKFRRSFWEHTGVHMCKGDLLPSITVFWNLYGGRGLQPPEDLFGKLLFARIIEMCRKLKFLLRGARRSNKCLQNKLEDSLAVNARLREELLSSDTKLSKMIEQVRRTLETSERDLKDKVSRLEEENAKLLDCINKQEKGLNCFNAYGRLKKLYKEVEHIKGKKHGI